MVILSRCMLLVFFLGEIPVRRAVASRMGGSRTHLEVRENREKYTNCLYMHVFQGIPYIYNFPQIPQKNKSSMSQKLAKPIAPFFFLLPRSYTGVYGGKKKTSGSAMEKKQRGPPHKVRETVYHYTPTACRRSVHVLACSLRAHVVVQHVSATRDWLCVCRVCVPADSCP